MAKSPAFQFYPADWLGSTKVDLMTLEEQGGYLRLLCHAWSDDNCSLPDDDDKLSRLSRLGEKWFKGSSKIIKECFTLKGNRLVSERLLEERKKQIEWREKSKRGGMKSGEARRIKALEAKGGLEMVATKDEPKGNTSSSSSSSSLSSSSTASISSKSPKHIYGELKHVRLTDEEHEKLVEKFGEADTQHWIKTLDEGLDLKDYKYKSHYRAILKWWKNPSNKQSNPDAQTKARADMIEGAFNDGE